MKNAMAMALLCGCAGFVIGFADGRRALAADCALSRSTLFERFTDLTGMTPMGYLLGWRMTLAMQWLSETGISIADIAERIGYGSASAFSVAFTRYTGISPGKYARQRAALNVSRPALT